MLKLKMGYVTYSNQTGSAGVTGRTAAVSAIQLHENRVKPGMTKMVARRQLEEETPHLVTRQCPDLVKGSDQSASALKSALVRDLTVHF